MNHYIWWLQLDKQQKYDKWDENIEMLSGKLLLLFCGTTAILNMGGVSIY